MPGLVQGGQECGVIQVINALTGDKHHVDGRQAVLMQTETFANQTFEPVALDRQPHLLAGEHQTDSGAFSAIGADQHQERRLGHLI